MTVILGLLATGLVSLLAQVVLLRGLQVASFGSELVTILALGLWLVGTAFGALVGRRARQATPAFVRAAFLTLAWSVPLSLVLARGLRPLLGGTPGAYLPFGRRRPASRCVLYMAGAAVAALLLEATLLLAYQTRCSVLYYRDLGLLLTAFMAGKTVPFALVSLVDLALVTLVARLWFHVPFVGNPFLFLGASLLYILCGLGIGLFISTISATQREAFLATFLFFMPTILLSGFMFPVSSMPAFFRWITLGNPMRHYLVIVRGVFLKGTGPEMVWPSLLALAALGLLSFAVAARRFRKIGA